MKGMPDVVLVAYDIVISLFKDAWEILVMLLAVTVLAHFVFGCWGSQVGSAWRHMWAKKCSKRAYIADGYGSGGGSGDKLNDEDSYERRKTKRSHRKKRKRRKKRKKDDDSSCSSQSCSTSSPSSASSSMSCLSCPASCSSYACSGPCCSFCPRR
ncbi:hypothetical protein PoB_003205500 [Plakobranchus ocellatus]|uniref:Uncharacterized protein n=1 Tax=Plakobranchus ocellatus TaxID=259542 RepID=A0AAV4AFK7_9GAST|nr:hypothetical protein PoB_003205500 [Plakobranchus ocellatus]